MADVSVGLNCPACGGAISVVEGEDIVVCPYCNSTLFIEGDEGVTTIAFKNRLTKQGAIDTSRSWWSRGWKARDLEKTGKAMEVYPIYLPFWRATTRVAGWICGYEIRRHTDSKGNVHEQKVPKEIMVLNDYQFSEIAADPGDLGIRSLRNFSGETNFADFDMIPTFEATTSKDDAVSHAKNEALSRARSSARVPRVTMERLHILPRRLSMVYYPVWVVRYSYKERMYLTTVDGVTGQLLSGRAPGDPLFQSLAITAGSSVGGLLAAGGIMLSVVATELAVAGLAAGAVVLYLTYRFFRHGSEIIEGDFKHKPASMAETMKELQDVAKALQGAYR
jgi:DNA-directed RNA polymerase subunit RPC12/RpoP